jgi:hypothetical protein
VAKLTGEQMAEKEMRLDSSGTVEDKQSQSR